MKHIHFIRHKTTVFFIITIAIMAAVYLLLASSDPVVNENLSHSAESQLNTEKQSVSLSDEKALAHKQPNEIEAVHASQTEVDDFELDGEKTPEDIFIHLELNRIAVDEKGYMKLNNDTLEVVEGIFFSLSSEQIETQRELLVQAVATEYTQEASNEFGVLIDQMLHYKRELDGYHSQYESTDHGFNLQDLIEFQNNAFGEERAQELYGERIKASTLIDLDDLSDLPFKLHSVLGISQEELSDSLSEAKEFFEGD